jgi:HK97 gp10 family phage protein
MAKLVTCEIKGLDILQKRLEEMKQSAARKVVKAGLQAGGDVIKAEMERQAPKESGFLSENINVKMVKRGIQDVAGKAYVGPDGKVFYPTGNGDRKPMRALVIAGWLERGTKKMAANPFLTRAFEASKETALFKIVATIKAKLGF